MKVAYADPPYMGCAKQHYNCEEIDHEELIEFLYDTFDSWALSCNTPTLKTILNYCGDDVRIMAWVKPWCKFIPGVGTAYAWEPVIAWNIRKRDRKENTIRDYIIANATRKKGTHGAKPEAFCYWLFEAMNWKEDDEFNDIFPGSGVVSECWRKYKKQNNIYLDKNWEV